MSEYTVKVVRLDTLKLNAKILIIPEDKVEEELSVFVGEHGLINKTAFEDFLLAAFVVNLSQLLVEIQKHPSLFEMALDFREELLDHVYTLNSALFPENLHIDATGKLATRPTTDSIKLNENKVWEQGSFGSSVTPRNGEPMFENPFDNLEYETVSEWWERLRMYVVIRSYSNDDCLKILNSRYFGDKPAFETFTVVVCIEDFQRLFETIDSFGVSKRIPSEQLMTELYGLCKKVNPMLTFSNAQKMDSYDDDEIASLIEDADMS